MHSTLTDNKSSLNILKFTTVAQMKVKAELKIILIQNRCQPQLCQNFDLSKSYHFIEKVHYAQIAD